MTPVIVTRSGRRFDFENPTPDMVCIEDIAHSLAYLCRFTGHTKDFYSVAQHSILVSEILPQNLQLAGLLHDATEAYVGDVSRPLKSLLPQYRDIEERVWRAVALAFRLPEELPPQVHLADRVLLVTEKRDLMRDDPEPDALYLWPSDVHPLPKKIQPWSSWMAKKVFLDRFHSA